MTEKLFRYDGYAIPEKLVMLTGGGTDDWQQITDYHNQMYQKYAPVTPDQTIVEVGCGVGRDAILLTKQLSKKGRYIGIDIIRPSIEWCQQNITLKHPNFEFVYFDIDSQIHNPDGKSKTTDIRIPVADHSVDRIFLHSVFTHMFEADITHYLREFRRILKPDGLVLTSFFVVDDQALAALEAGKSSGHRHPLSFRFKRTSDCYINDQHFPEGAVGYTPNALKRMLTKAGMALADNVVHRGAWSGIQPAANGQDVVILRPSNGFEGVAAYFRPLTYSGE